MTMEDFLALLTVDETRAYWYWMGTGEAWNLWEPFVWAFIIKRTVDHDGFKALLDSMLDTTQIFDQARYDELMLSRPA